MFDAVVGDSISSFEGLCLILSGLVLNLDSLVFKAIIAVGLHNFEVLKVSYFVEKGEGRDERI